MLSACSHSEKSILCEENIVKISQGIKNEDFFISETGNVYVLSDDKNTLTKEKINNIVEIASGYNHVIALKKDGTVWVKGENDKGQLGIGEASKNGDFQQVAGLKNIVSVSAGKNFSVALDENGVVWSWGDNSCGQLAIQPHKTIYYPMKSNFKEPISDISCGTYHLLVLDEKGNVLASGNNKNGELGNTDILNDDISICVDLGIKSTFILAGENYSAIISNEGNVYSFGEPSAILGIGDLFGKNTSIPQQLDLQSIKTISANKLTMIAVDENNCLYFWGASYKKSRRKEIYSEFEPVKIKKLKADEMAHMGNSGIFLINGSNKIKLIEWH